MLIAANLLGGCDWLMMQPGNLRGVLTTLVCTKLLVKTGSINVFSARVLRHWYLEVRSEGE